LNVGSNDNIATIDLATEIRDQIAPDLGIEYADRFAGEADHTHADTSNASELIGYEPSHTISEGSSKFIDWYRKNREWYEPLVHSS